jgi:hypothetical protein
VADRTILRKKRIFMLWACGAASNILPIMRTRLLLAFLGLAMAHAFAQATLNTYTDKAAFLAPIGATNATRPIPNIGKTDSCTVGSLIFKANSGGTAIYVGAGSGIIPGNDWYPPSLKRDRREAPTKAWRKIGLPNVLCWLRVHRVKGGKTACYC